jgi:outer membrane protein
MNNKLTIILIIVIIVLIQRLPVFSQENMTLEQVRTLALANSRSLAKYDLAFQSGLLDEKAQTYSNFPSLSLGVSASVGLWDKNGPDGGMIRDSLSTGASFSISQKLFNGGKSLVLKRINDIAAAITRTEALAEYYAVLETADAAYYAVLQAGANLEAAESSLRTAVLALSVAEVRRANGMIKEGDYLQSQAEKESKENSRNQARRDLQLGYAKLKNLTGLAGLPVLETVNMEVYEALLSRLSGLQDEEAESLYADLWKASARNPSLVKAGLSGRRAEQNVSLAKRDYAPSLSASFSTGLNYSADGGFEPGSGRLSISGSIPLDFWTIANSVKKSSIEREQAVLDYKGAESTLALEIEAALLEILSRAGSILSSRRALEYAEKHLDYVMELYTLSQNSAADVSDASSLVSSSRSQLIQAEFGFLSGLSRLRSLGAFEFDDDLTAMLLHLEN